MSFVCSASRRIPGALWYTPFGACCCPVGQANLVLSYMNHDELAAVAVNQQMLALG